MPYKKQHFGKHIPKELKRSYKLSDAQRADIRKRHKAGESTYSIAKSYKGIVTRRTVSFVINPEKAKKTYTQSNKKRVITPEKRAEYQRRHRKYKHSIKDKLLDEKKIFKNLVKAIEKNIEKKEVKEPIVKLRKILKEFNEAKSILK